jgi:hypothetical protein
MAPRHPALHPEPRTRPPHPAPAPGVVRIYGPVIGRVRRCTPPFIG